MFCEGTEVRPSTPPSAELTLLLHLRITRASTFPYSLRSFPPPHPPIPSATWTKYLPDRPAVNFSWGGVGGHFFKDIFQSTKRLIRITTEGESCDLYL